MTVIDKSVFSGLTGASSAVINQALQILNDPRLTLAEPLRQALARGAIVVRWPKAEDAIKPSDHAIFINPETNGGVITVPGQIVLKPAYLQSDGPLSVLYLIDNLIHEGQGHGDSRQILDRTAAFRELRNSGLSPTDRGDRFITTWLDDETSARYQSYLVLKQTAELNLWEPGRIRFVLASYPVFAEFKRLEPLAAAKNLTGEEKEAFMIENARSVMAGNDKRSYVNNFTAQALKGLNLTDGTPEAAAFRAHVQNTYNLPCFEMTGFAMHDDGSSSGSVVFENGNRTDLVFDISGNLFRRTDTISGSADSGRATIISTYLPGSDQPERIEFTQSDASGQVSTTYTQDANGNWTPTSWTQEGQSSTSGDLRSFITNVQNQSNASDTSASQSTKAGQLNQLIASVSGENVAGVAVANGNAASLATLGVRLGMPDVSDRWAPAVLSGQIPTALLLSSGMYAAVSQALAFNAQSRINALQDRPSTFTVNVLGFGSEQPSLPRPLQSPTVSHALPLVLDLDDDGLKLVSMDRSTAIFDANGTGTPQVVGWVGHTEGILVLDKNGNGVVDNAGEWFGQKFAVSGTAPAGQDGFKALATLANSGASTLSAATSRINAATGKRYFDELQVWVDADQDGKTDTGELRSLASLGITSIDLTSQTVNRAVNGNVIVSKAGYTTADGKRHEISDVGLSTEVPVPRDGTIPVSAAALAFADYAGKGYAAMATGQARAIAAAIQGIPSGEQAAISALQQRFVLPTGTGFDQASFEARAKMSWAVQAGLVRTALNDKITYFVGPDGDRATIPAASRRINTAPSDVVNVLNGIAALRTGELTVANAIDAAASTLGNAQTKAQVANATQTSQSREDAWLATLDATKSWNGAISGYLDVKAQMDAMIATLPAVQNKLNEVVPVNLSLTGHLSNGGTFLTRSDAMLAAEAFRAYASALQPLAALKVTGDQLLSAIAQSQGYTRVYAGENGKTTSVENGYNLLLGNRGSQTFVLGSGVDNIAVTSATGNITVSGFQVGSRGDQIQFLSGGLGSIDISSDGSGNAILKLDGSTVTLLGVDPNKLDLFANLAGVAGVSFATLASGVRSLKGVEVYDGQMHVTYLRASNSGDTLIGGERGSYLVGNAGNDTFIVTGRDYKIESWGGQDTVSYAELGVGVRLEQITLTERDDDQWIQVVVGRDNLGNTLRDVTNIVGSDFNDVLTTDDAASNVINGGKGNDVLAGGLGSDTYVFALGDGVDSIEEAVNSAGDIDTVSFASGVAPANVKVTRVGEDLVMAYSASDSITMRHWFAASPQGIERVSFADGTKWDRAKISSLVNAPTVLHPLAGQNVTEDAAWTFVLPADTFAAEDGTVLSLSATLANGAALPSWLRFDAASWTFTGTPLNADVGNVVLAVTATNPVGGNASTTLAINIANTNDSPIANTPLASGYAQWNTRWTYVVPEGAFLDIDAGDRLAFTAKIANGAPLPAWLSFDTSTRTLSGVPGNTDVGELDLQIFATDLSGASVSQKFHLSIGSAAPPILGTAGNDVLTGTPGNDTLDGGLGNDRLNGGAGDDIYRFRSGDGNDQVFDSGGRDVVELLDMNASDVRVGSNGFGSDVLIIRATGQEISLDFGISAFDGYSPKIEELKFANGTVWGAQQLHAAANANEVLVGTSGADTLRGFGGDDVIEGGRGDDLLLGGTGNDIYRYRAGDGNDVIFDQQGNDTLELVGLNSSDITYSNLPSLSGFELRINATGERITVKNSQYLTNALENIKFANGEVWDIKKIGYLGGTNVQTTQVYVGTDGNDRLWGGYFNDILDGGRGDDYLEGGERDSVFKYRSGDGFDLISDYGGQDQVELKDLNSADVRIVSDASGDRIIDRATGQFISLDLGIRTYISSGVVPDCIEQVVFADGTVWNTPILAAASQANEILVGTSGNQTLEGYDGDDVLDGYGGNDTLKGGRGNDSYRLNRGYGRSTIVENDATAGNTDSVIFGTDIAVDQLWFRQVGNALEVSVIGGTDQFTINDWYLGSKYHVEQFKTGGGKTLLESQVQNLVQAMAGFAPPAAGQTTLPPNYQSTLAPVLAANWQ